MFIEPVIESYSSTKCKSIEKIVYKMLENGNLQILGFISS